MAWKGPKASHSITGQRGSHSGVGSLHWPLVTWGLHGGRGKRTDSEEYQKGGVAKGPAGTDPGPGGVGVKGCLPVSVDWASGRDQ